jgi:chromosome segregation ATPase
MSSKTKPALVETKGDRNDSGMQQTLDNAYAAYRQVLENQRAELAKVVADRDARQERSRAAGEKQGVAESRKVALLTTQIALINERKSALGDGLKKRVSEIDNELTVIGHELNDIAREISDLGAVVTDNEGKLNSIYGREKALRNSTGLLDWFSRYGEQSNKINQDVLTFTKEAGKAAVECRFVEFGGLIPQRFFKISLPDINKFVEYPRNVKLIITEIK